jgi:hypothetical protein
MKDDFMRKMLSTTLLIILYAIAAYADPSTNATSEELQLLRDFASQTGAKITPSEQEINETCKLLWEGTSFFIYLLSTNALPATPTNSVAKTVQVLDPPTFKGTYPVKVRVDVKRKQGDMHVYSLIKNTPSNNWFFSTGWEVTNGVKGSLLKLPSDADQIRANDALPAMMQEWESEEQCSTNGVKI